jgi:hypothetical protein
MTLVVAVVVAVDDFVVVVVVLANELLEKLKTKPKHFFFGQNDQFTHSSSSAQTIEIDNRF